MGTRSRIGLEYSDGTIKSIYCHWDGYPSHNGKILLEDYTDREKVVQLLELGDLSSLGINIGEKHDFNAKAPEGTCTFYGRDRGEEDTEARISSNRTEFKELTDQTSGAYAYLYVDGTWLYDPMEHLSTFLRLTPEIIERD